MKSKDISYQDFIAQLYPDAVVENPVDKTKMATSNVTFQVTDACNLCCTYCYQINKGTHRMSFDIAKRFIDMLIDNDENTRQYIDTRAKKAIVIDFIGREPFLEIELIDKICDYFVEQMFFKDHPWQYNYRIFRTG